MYEVKTGDITSYMCDVDLTVGRRLFVKTVCEVQVTDILKSRILTTTKT